MSRMEREQIHGSGRELIPWNQKARRITGIEENEILESKRLIVFVPIFIIESKNRYCLAVQRGFLLR